ncbi:hypothetical protein QTL95_08095 [Rhizobium sp. S152]|uniref:hypothetical protein n=1 Tax=Rhizobium sp. S152 TaxID=3055038 RepID=UPI0025A9EAB9|nr:hypothetical protein [Rhizobium sp. S152]MDM9625853.1 hypothetical protein [Rhizobium sp. S152]
MIAKKHHAAVMISAYNFEGIEGAHAGKCRFMISSMFLIARAKERFKQGLATIIGQSVGYHRGNAATARAIDDIID